MAFLDDCDHVIGSDLQASPTGDIARVNNSDRSEQRVLRRLMTNPGAYPSHPNYGAGLPQLIGEDLNISALQTPITGQMLLEPSVSKSPGPTAVVTPIPNGASIAISYIALPDQQPVALSFNLP